MHAQTHFFAIEMGKKNHFRLFSHFSPRGHIVHHEYTGRAKVGYYYLHAEESDFSLNTTVDWILIFGYLAYSLEREREPLATGLRTYRRCLLQTPNVFA